MGFLVKNLGGVGLITDNPSSELPPQAFQEAYNVRFKNSSVKSALGYAEYKTPIKTPEEKFIKATAIANGLYFVTDSKSYLMRNDVITTLVEPPVIASGRFWSSIVGKSTLPVAVVSDKLYGLYNDSEWKALPKFGNNRLSKGVVNLGKAFHSESL